MPGCSASNSWATSSHTSGSGPVVPLCHHVSVTSPSPPSPPPSPALQAVSEATARPVAAASVTSLRVLRLFIIEPLESFDVDVESDLDVSKIPRQGYRVKPNQTGPATRPRPPAAPGLKGGRGSRNLRRRAPPKPLESAA